MKEIEWRLSKPDGCLHAVPKGWKSPVQSLCFLMVDPGVEPLPKHRPMKCSNCLRKVVGKND